MARLEYRLLDDNQGYPILYYYDPIDKDEISMRFTCNYFIKDNTVYEKTSCVVEISTYIIYVKPSEEEKVIDLAAPSKQGPSAIRIEVREYKEDTAIYAILQTFDFHNAQDALLHLQSDYLFLAGREWEKTSSEIDEDRKVYVYYVQPSE